MEVGVEIHSQTLYGGREYKLEVSISSLISEFGETHGIGQRKMVGVRVDGRHQENMATI